MNNLHLFYYVFKARPIPSGSQETLGSLDSCNSQRTQKNKSSATAAIYVSLYLILSNFLFIWFLSLKIRNSCKTVKKIKGKNGKPDKIELIVTVDLVFDIDTYVLFVNTGILG